MRRLTRISDGLLLACGKRLDYYVRLYEQRSYRSGTLFLSRKRGCQGRPLLCSNFLRKHCQSSALSLDLSLIDTHARTHEMAYASGFRMLCCGHIINLVRTRPQDLLDQLPYSHATGVRIWYRVLSVQT
jgi:hypothetical protein